MSTLKTNNVQVGQSVTATNNFTLYQPATPDGTVRLGVGNSGATTADVITANSSGNVGIGTSSPQAKLNSISAGAALGGTAQFAIGLSTNNYENTYFRIDNSGNSNFCIDQIFGGVSYNRLLIERTTGNLKFDSGYGSAATAYGCRAWVNFNGTGTVAIRASGNVTSITDNGTGDYTVNFTNAMPDANYGVGLGIQAQTSGVAGLSRNVSSTTSAYRLLTTDASGTASDFAYINVAIFR